MSPSSPVIISLEQLMENAPHALIALKTNEKASDIIIEWRVEVDVKDRGAERYHVYVVLASEGLDAETAEAVCTPLTSQDERQIFAYIPVHAYGSDAFGIFISETPYGDVLTESLVQEIIEKAGIEQAVDTWQAG